MARRLRHTQPADHVCHAQLGQEHHSEIIDALRTLAGAAPLQMPASIDLVADPELKDRFERWWGTSSMPALDRLKLYKLVWDLIGSEFAGRHMLYERFYAGNSIIVRNQSDREAPWETMPRWTVCWNACRRPNRRDNSSDGRHL